ncbi:diuretic hormone receptor-like [Frankliniella occidentalis]|uniref:Diuretic hormone receptor-like n=1 Tax=Frankliniella occidentalis TaxID=133901 RepID=A0A9C6XT33_FRAOC|nr:diuretic hormone receptor-like [Frankliniella occidentalis]
MGPPRGLALVLLACCCWCAGVAGHSDEFVDEYIDDPYNSTNLFANISNPEEALRCADLQLQYEAAPPANHCEPFFDKVLCWEHQPAGTLASQTCFAELNGVPYDNNGRNATRMCHPNATWDQTTNYSACMKDLANANDPGNLHTEVTSTIYYVGYTVSTIVLTVAVFIFSHFSELHCLRNRIHMNLMLAYIGADIVWILNMTVNVYLGHESTEFCIIFTVLLQYTLLTHFLWMFVEGLYLFTLVVMTFQQHSAKLPVYLVIGWGTPLVAVVAWVITRLVRPPPDQGEREGPQTCPWWQEHWADRIWIQAPCILVLVVNSIFLVFIMYVSILKRWCGLSTIILVVRVNLYRDLYS